MVRHNGGFLGVNMGIRGELYTTHVNLDNRNYFFNVKENRAGDVFLQVVESKEGEASSRHAIVVFAEDMQRFLKGFEDSLAFIDKDRKTKSKAAAERKAQKAGQKKLIYKKKTEHDKPPVKKTGRVHIVSKRKPDAESES